MYNINQILSNMGLNLDSSQTAYLTRQLTQIRSQVYQKLYPEFIARYVIPNPLEQMNAGAEFMSYSIGDGAGEAKIIANNSTDLSLVEYTENEVLVKNNTLGIAYSYTIDDIEASIFSGKNLSSKKAMIANQLMQKKIDDMLSTGDNKLKGLINQPITGVNAVNTYDNIHDWDATATTANQILEDIGKMIIKIRVDSKGVHNANTLLIPETVLSILLSKLSSATDMNVMKLIKDNFPEITTIRTWHKLDTIATGSKPRVIAYHSDATNLEAQIPKEPQQLPPQAKGLSFMVPIHARVVGCVVTRPKSICYLDDPFTV